MYMYCRILVRNGPNCTARTVAITQQLGSENNYCKLPVYNNYIIYNNTVLAITQSHIFILFFTFYMAFFFSGEMQLHLQAMVNLLRDEDVLRLVRLTMIVSIFVMYIL